MHSYSVAEDGLQLWYICTVSVRGVPVTNGLYVAVRMCCIVEDGIQLWYICTVSVRGVPVTNDLYVAVLRCRGRITTVVQLYC